MIAASLEKPFTEKYITVVKAEKIELRGVKNK